MSLVEDAEGGVLPIPSFTDEDGQPLLPLPGTVGAQMIVCGTAGCHCRTGIKHGPYFYRVWREGSQVHKVYVCADDVERVRQQCALHREIRLALKAVRGRVGG